MRAAHGAWSMPACCRATTSAASAPRRTLVARRGGNTAEIPLPYAIAWPQPEGLLRVERDVAPVTVGDAEAAQERAYVTTGLQWLDPAWRWTGPDIPRQKPVLSQIFVGGDGSAWALREGEAVDGDDPDHDTHDASSVERRLKSRLSFDVFTAAGDDKVCEDRDHRRSRCGAGCARLE